MIDTDALSWLPDLCSRVTVRHKRSLNRLTLLLNGHDWMGQAPAHAYKLSVPLPKNLREVKRGLSMADMVAPLITKQRRISTFPCTAATSAPHPSTPEHAKPGNAPQGSRNDEDAPAPHHASAQIGDRPAEIAPIAQGVHSESARSVTWIGRTRLSKSG